MFRPTTLRAVLTSAAAVLLMLSLPAEAQWKWKDKSGRVQYSDLPPPAGTPDSDILAKPAIQQPKRATAAASAASGASAAGGTSTLAPRTVDPDLEAKRKAAESEKNAKGKAEEDRVANAKADNCNRAKLQLRDLDSGVRISRSNAQGEREFLDDKQRADETKRAKDTIGTDCK